MLPLRCFLAVSLVSPMLAFALVVPLLAERLKSLSHGARAVLKRTTPAPPRFTVYHDAWSYPFPSAPQLQGYNVYTLSFWLTSGAADMALGWEQLSVSERASYIEEYNAAGISLIVSAFGSTETPTSSGANPAVMASRLASWVIQYGVQGVDVDYEDFNAFNYGGGSAENWLVAFTQQIRVHLPRGEYILSHAPVAPWFSPTLWTGGGYLAVHKTVGSLIDWYNIQFYNQGTSEYTTCHGLITASSSTWPETALFQIAANGVPLDKLLIGKPGTSVDADNGYMGASMLTSCVAQAHSSGWNAGVMVWEYPHVGSSWIVDVRGNTWPMFAGLPPPPMMPSSTTTTSIHKTTTLVAPPATGSTTTKTATETATSSSPSPSPSSGSLNNICTNVSTWTSDIAYVRGNRVAYRGGLWIANQWNQDEMPGGVSGAWDNHGSCYQSV